MKLLIILIITLANFIQVKAQLEGTVVDSKNRPIFAANVYTKEHPQKGVTTNIQGKFKLTNISNTDTLIVSFIGYKTAMIPLINKNISNNLIVVLRLNSKILQEISVLAKEPISEKFTVAKMSKLEIYFNPVSQGDPLKAITVLPMATSTDESAKPSLRGSSPDRTRVVFNGVPIYNPVRSSQLNNQGFFSLFNPEIIKKQYVYGGNPPLTYGNSSAGLIEITTNNELTKDNMQFSVSLASTGVFINKKLKNNNNFVQLYGNYGFSNAFVNIQKKQLPSIKNFESNDFGCNFHSKISNKISFNSFNYFISEKFRGTSSLFNYSGNVETSNKRFFSVNNISIKLKNAILKINDGLSGANKRFLFGNIYSNSIEKQNYFSINYYKQITDNLNIQTGFSSDFANIEFNDSVPINYYVITSNSYNTYYDTSLSNFNNEAFLYSVYKYSDAINISAGLRANIPFNKQNTYLSSQLAIKYNLSNIQSFILSGGLYHSYSVPNYFNKNFKILSSMQMSLDYSYELSNGLIKSGVYYKNEKGDQIDNYISVSEIKTYGVEAYLEYNFLRNIKFTFSNSYINQKVNIEGNEYHGNKDFKYFAKASVQFIFPKFANMSVTYSQRPGTYYTSLDAVGYNNTYNYYYPIFNNQFYNNQYNDYSRLDISVNKLIGFKKHSIVLFASVNNVLNKKNQKVIKYSYDFKTSSYEYFQYRVIYFGFIFQLN